MSDTDYSQIYLDIDDPIATITLNRPQVLNAWTPVMGEELRDAVARAEQDRRVVALVLTGAGRGFCAGADLSAFTDLIGDQSHDGSAGLDAKDLLGSYSYLRETSKPVIAAVNGAAAGVGFVLALSCDLRMVNHDAVLTTSFAQRGLVAEYGASWLLNRLVGPERALDLLMTGRKFSGVEAARLGLAHHCVEGGAVLAAAQDYVRDLARSSSPASLAAMKRQVYADLELPFMAAELDSVNRMLANLNSADIAEGVQAFVQRRTPQFDRLPALDDG